ncbi:TAXI family TRAP transporter solute-binding subunit [Variovorax sp. PCZ-1]|uniref:TAXI family TRAP transporter solute-binding subunit n=1 Tax=Variovorax sp. PCZ-1 TaxID=2835533 RepID=UPI001BCEC105|nr:TAXI family TRAP transporter solute-binding subunit [Variovorax sp. PCZ-1]MBS7807028.1 ABC transporter substrate-binding protein [Variovorax sp. PCZ-1]
MVIPQLSHKQQFFAAAAFMAILGFIIWALMRYISPAPPRIVTMTTGAADGAYHHFGEKYQAYLKANGIKLELKTSAGSVQNLERLEDTKINAGFVQGGLGQLSIDPNADDDNTPLRSLAVIGYEPLWVFAQNPEAAKKLGGSLLGLKGMRIAVGAEGSGTRKVALDLLKAYGVSAENATLEPNSGMAATQALLDKKLDAIILIASPQAPAVQKLIDPGNSATLINLAQAEGITRRLPYLSTVVLKAGSVDPVSQTPPQDVTLLTTTANLVVRQDTHPAIAYLLLEAARDTHKGATLLSRPSEFPHPRGTDFPLSEEATRYFKDGRPFLQRYLPFWLANALQRLLLILIPLAAIGIPVIKLIPELLQFKEKNRLYRRYGQLLKIETDIRSRQLSQQEINSARADLNTIESEISRTKFTLEFADRVYTLRQHVDYVRGQLQNEQDSLNSPKAS